MDIAIAYTLLSVALVSVVALIGIFFLSLKESNLRKVLTYLVSFAAGALFGDAFFHLLPEAVEKIGFGARLSFGVLGGILFFFIVEKIIHWRHCHLPITKEHTHPFALMNLIGDVVHNFLDGLIIGASYLVSVPVGIATTAAVILHEIPQEISDFGVLLHGGFSRAKALWYNFLTSLSAFVGAILALVIGVKAGNFEAMIVPIAAGGFIYIAGADLIPELHKEVEAKKSLVQVITIMFGIAVMFALTFLE